jgi:endonuclease YncB( thermonuclease family)
VRVSIIAKFKRNLHMRWIAAPLILVVLAVTTHGDEIRGKVVSIADGDTITLLDAAKVQHKIRFQGIDAPEKKQAFGTKSKEVLSEKIGEKEVVVTWKEKDRYGRILGEVMLGNRHINLEMVQDGMAWHYKQYSKSKELANAEDAARKAEEGLWVDKEPVPPWEFRKNEREKKQTEN